MVSAPDILRVKYIVVDFNFRNKKLKKCFRRKKIKERINKWDYIKFKSCMAKETSAK